MLVEPPGQDYLRAHVKLKVLAFLSTAGGSALSALWTFPSILASAFLVAWGAEAAQFLISQGLALAILAWLQTLPEFAVEAVIAWDAGREPERAHLAIANLTGAIRLLLGLGWPMIYFVFAISGRTRAAGAAQHAAPLLPAIRLEREHALEIVGLVPPLLYFGVILLKQSLSWVDAVVLLALYVVYLWFLFRNAPRGAEHVADAPPASPRAHPQPRRPPPPPPARVPRGRRAPPSPPPPPAPPPPPPAAAAAPAATAASRCPVRGAEGDRPDASQGPHADPRETLLCRSHPQCSLQASGPRDRPEPEAGEDARTR